MQRTSLAKVLDASVKLTHKEGVMLLFDMADAKAGIEYCPINNQFCPTL